MPLDLIAGHPKCLGPKTRKAFRKVDCIPERGQRPSWSSTQRSDFSRITVAVRSGEIQSGGETTPSICSLCHLLKGPVSQGGAQRCFAAKGQQCSELNT